MKKKETLEEAADEWVFETNGHKWSNNDDTAGDNHYSFKNGAKWQQERMYSEEDMIEFAKWIYLEVVSSSGKDRTNKELFKEWFEQFKKKEL